MWSGPGVGGNALPGRPEGEPSNRIEEQELEEAGRRRLEDEAMHTHDARRPGFFSRLFRRRPSVD
jgi:hypothetical protein